MYFLLNFYKLLNAFWLPKLSLTIKIESKKKKKNGI